MEAPAFSGDRRRVKVLSQWRHQRFGSASILDRNEEEKSPVEMHRGHWTCYGLLSYLKECCLFVVDLVWLHTCSMNDSDMFCTCSRLETRFQTNKKDIYIYIKNDKCNVILSCRWINLNLKFHPWHMKIQTLRDIYDLAVSSKCIHLFVRSKSGTMRTYLNPSVKKTRYTVNVYKMRLNILVFRWNPLFVSISIHHYIHFKPQLYWGGINVMH